MNGLAARQHPARIDAPTSAAARTRWPHGSRRPGLSVTVRVPLMALSAPGGTGRTPDAREASAAGTWTAWSADVVSTLDRWTRLVESLRQVVEGLILRGAVVALRVTPGDPAVCEVWATTTFTASTRRAQIDLTGFTTGDLAQAVAAAGLTVARPDQGGSAWQIDRDGAWTLDVVRPCG